MSIIPLNHTDTYSSFKELEKHQRIGKDYRIVRKDRKSKITVLAPHGGKIEPGTSQIAQKIAGSVFNLYCFEGIKRKCNYKLLHITSHHYDEPECLSLLSKSNVVIAIHGRRGTGKKIIIGGRNEALIYSLMQKLQEAGFIVIRGTGKLAAIHKKNICNRGKTKKGVQIEIPKSLRSNFNVKDFARNVRDVIK